MKPASSDPGFLHRGRLRRASADRRLREMAEVLTGKKRLLVLTHDHPDPDCIASGWGLLKVIRRLKRMTVDFGYGGTIGRSENRTLRDVLQVPLAPISTLDLQSYDAFALVDSQPETGNNSLPVGVLPTIVIDHHPCRRRTREVPYFDVREDYGATATIVAEYLAAADAPIDRRLATAFFYAIKTETRNLGREASRADVRAFLEFFPRVDNVALSAIEHPRIPRAYFAMIDRLIAGAQVQGRFVTALLGPVEPPEVVAEFADMLVRMEDADWALAIGRYRGSLLLSLRTNLTSVNAGRVIQRIVRSDGTAGGHGMMAGGRVTPPTGSEGDPAALDRLEQALLARARRLVGAPARGGPLVRRTSAKPS